MSDVGGCYNIAMLGGSLATILILNQFGSDTMVSKLFKKKTEKGKKAQLEINTTFTKNGKKFLNEDLGAIKEVMLGKESVKKKSCTASCSKSCRICC